MAGSDSGRNAQIGVRIDEETRSVIEEELEYGDSLSEWVREAIELRIESEGLCEENRTPAAVMAD